MNEMVEQWLRQHGSLRGLLACGVRYPDETIFVPPTPAGFSKQNLEYSLRCMADTYQVLKLNSFPTDYVRWIYQNALVYCIKRADGIFLALFTNREAEAVDLEGLGKMLGEFHELGAASHATTA